VIKFLGARQENAERLGIIGINIIGYEQNEDAVSQQLNLVSSRVSEKCLTLSRRLKGMSITHDR